MRKKKRTFIIGLLIIFSLLFVLSYLVFFQNPYWIKIEDEIIQKEEINFFIEESRSFIQSEYQSKIKEELTEEEFWNYKIDNITPEDALLLEAAKEAVKAKTIQIWAKEKGLIKDISYKAFQKEQKQQNQRRKEAIEKKEVIYGPVSYSEREYYTYRLLELKQKIIEKEEQNVVKRKELYRYYRQHRNSYKKADTVHGIFNIWENGFVVSTQKVEINHETIRSMTESNEELVEHLMKLSKGQAVTWEGENGQQFQLICTLHKKGGYYPFEEVIQAVGGEYMEEWFENQLENRIAQSNIRYYGKISKVRKEVKE